MRPRMISCLCAQRKHTMFRGARPIVAIVRRDVSFTPTSSGRATAAIATSERAFSPCRRSARTMCIACPHVRRPGGACYTAHNPGPGASDACFAYGSCVLVLFDCVDDVCVDLDLLGGAPAVLLRDRAALLDALDELVGTVGDVLEHTIDGARRRFGSGLR